MPKLSELSISDCPPPALSGLRISFGQTLQYLACKTVTRRSWKDSHAKKFINSFQQNKLIKALDKDIRYGGKQIGWCRLLCAPYKEQLAAMPEADLQAEGGMCSSVGQFIKRYFKGNSSLEVWVIRFEFIELNQPIPTQTPPSLGVYSNSGTKTNSNSVLTSLATSIHQTQLLDFGVYPDFGRKTNSYSLLPLETKSIHQGSLANLGVYSQREPKTNSYFLFSLSIDSIHQAYAEAHQSFGVYCDFRRKTHSYFLIHSPITSIHQASLTTLGVYFAIRYQANSYFPLSLSINSIHQASLKPRSSFNVPSKDSNPSNSNHPVYPTTESIEQPSDAASLEHQTNPGVYQKNGNEVDTNNAISLPKDSIHQDCLSSFGVYSNSNNQTDTNAPINALAESIHQAQLVQGGNGLVYSFWKGESTVNHYRYKVKVNGKWQVKSVYIPVGKLPKVKEAIANNLGVAAIVVEVLSRKL